MKVISYLISALTDGAISLGMFLLGVVLLLGVPLLFVVMWRTCSRIGNLSTHRVLYDGMQT